MRDTAVHMYEGGGSVKVILSRVFSRHFSEKLTFQMLWIRVCSSNFFFGNLGAQILISVLHQEITEWMQNFLASGDLLRVQCVSAFRIYSRGYERTFLNF